MTKVQYEKSEDGLTLRVMGHAGFDHIGQDIVCAAISILCQALLAALDRLPEADVYHRRRDGLFVIDADSKMYDERQKIEGAFLTAVTGYRMLAEKYPDYVQFEWLRGLGEKSETEEDTL